MTASVMHLLDSLESRLEQAQAELHALRKENAQLKQQLVEQAVSLQEILEKPDPNAQQVPQTAVLAEAMAEIQVKEQHEPDVQQAPMPENASLDSNESPSPHALLKEWYQRYPQAFFKGHTKPLKVGIHQDLAASEPWSGKLIRRALANYVNLPRYLKSVREGVERIDLGGQPAGKVDKQAALHASEKRKEKQGSSSSTKTPDPAKNKMIHEKPYTEKKRSAPEFEPVAQVTNQKNELEKSVSLEDKLKGLQQKFEGR